MKMYVINGSPVPLARARHARNVVYDPQKNQKFFDAITISGQHGKEAYLEGPLHMEVTFYMPIPPTKAKKSKEPIQGKQHIFKPDLSNCIKYIEDVCARHRIQR